jgi:hypothetical protein
MHKKAVFSNHFHFQLEINEIEIKFYRCDWKDIQFKISLKF